MAGRVLLIVHQANSNPGRVGRALRALGYTLDLRRPALGDALPATMEDHAGAIVFGGPMNVNETLEHPYLQTEMDWFPLALDSGKPFLGICLGAQMLAKVLGARVRLHPKGLHEIGYFPIHPAPAGASLFDPRLHVYQWHSYGFGLPRGAELLARGETFANQAFRYGRAAYGIQFHPEVTAKIVDFWTTAGAHRLNDRGAQPRQTQLSQMRRHEPGIRVWLRRFLPHWLGPKPIERGGSGGA